MQSLYLDLKIYLVFLISLVLIIHAQDIIAGGDYEKVIYECKIKTARGESIEGYVEDSLAYNEMRPPVCDKKRIANNTIYRNVHLFNTLPISKMLGKDSYIYKALSKNVYVSVKDLIKINLNDIVLSTGSISESISDSTPFNILPDKTMNILISKKPYAVLGFGSDLLSPGPKYIVVSFDVNYDSNEKLETYFDEIGNKVSSEVRSRTSEIAEKYRNQITNIYKRDRKDFSGKPLNTEHDLETAVLKEINSRADMEIESQIQTDIVKELKKIESDTIILIRVQSSGC